MRVSTVSQRALTANSLLQQGSRGSAVVTLQKQLAALGFSPGAADGIFGSNTAAAVKRFQSSKGLAADGIVGPKTQAALKAAASSSSSSASATGHATISLGAKGPAVSEMQRLLAQAGYNPGSVDGQFGPNTQRALLSFQRAHGLSADGICGPKTWSALSSSFQPSGTNSSTPTLKNGASGQSVVQLQQLLAKAGFSPGTIDGKFGSNTQSAVIGYQNSRGLVADGIVGPKTWSALKNNAPAVNNSSNASGTLRERILSVAQSQIGTLETGTNSGPCLKYPNFFGRGSEAWCADFVSWVNTKAGNPMNDPYCPSIVNTLKAEGRWKGKSNPQPGDMVLFDWNGDKVADHIGIVKSVNSNGSVQTIEGNASNGSQQGVWEHNRSLSTILGFGNP